MKQDVFADTVHREWIILGTYSWGLGLSKSQEVSDTFSYGMGQL